MIAAEASGPDVHLDAAAIGGQPLWALGFS